MRSCGARMLGGVLGGVLGAALLTACGTDGPLIKRGDEPSAGQTAPPTAGASPAGPSPGAAVQVGKKTVSIASEVFDKTCERVVASYQASDNFGELLTLAVDMAGRSFGSTVDQAVADLNSGKGATAAGKQQGKTLKRALPIELRRAALRMNWMPMQFELLYGREMLKKLPIVERKGRAEASYVRAQALLDDVLKGVKEPYDYKFEILVSSNSGENAEALPGGFVVIDRALVDQPALRDKAYFAVAHEVAHVLQRHQTRALQARVIDSLALGASVKDLVQTMRQSYAEPIAVVRVLIGGKLLFEKHAENQELQSDACGMRVLYTGFDDKRRMLSAVEAFARDLPREPEVKAVKVSTTPGSQAIQAADNLVELVSRPVDAHPSTQDRLGNIQKMLVALRQDLPALVKPTVAVPKTPQPVAPARPVVKPLPTLTDTKKTKT